MNWTPTGVSGFAFACRIALSIALMTATACTWIMVTTEDDVIIDTSYPFDIRTEIVREVNKDDEAKPALP